MAEPVIELDLSSAWEPPEPPPVLRFRLRSRWVVACAVLAVAAGVLAASGAKPRTGPLYRVDQPVAGVTVAKDLLVVNRQRQPGGDPTIEGRRRSDGKVLWSITTDQEQQFAMLGATALILVRQFNVNRGYTTTLTAVDQATGRQLWTRPRTSVLGTHGGLVVAEEMTDPGRVITVATSETPDLTVNQALSRPARHILVLDERTGEPVWELTAPPGVVLDFTWDGRYPAGQVTGVDQLDPSGLVSSRDIRSGAVGATHQLDWSGTPAAFHIGAGWYAAPRRGAARAVVHPDGQRGGIVFDLAGGRALFSTDASMFAGIYQCAAALFCATSGNGITTYDATTGRPRWHLDRYTEIAAIVGDRFVVGTFEPEGATYGQLAVVDARTGAVTAALGGWRMIVDASAERILLWQPIGPSTAVLGELDVATGGVTVFGRAGNWYGPPQCGAAGDTLACVQLGALSVWRLPARHRGTP
ncbi:PQQ-binding-like beta-propeller repeat protein [Dactylosporangium siamense]|uniref:Pyrrolo-quinoline quinone repeat domain-containing protein n=1 Tax=Dactylosporangium siamense TaxID=685454 RepID=A0A919U9Y5_9ACTN|nr:PQQ-binding-like beta-propeller repeat protein [Dactylosporangium siamense]GIG44200.1 hypothetical protein Dsi01nite_022410 [Dactylosporangium siamense]